MTIFLLMAGQSSDGQEAGGFHAHKADHPQELQWGATLPGAIQGIQQQYAYRLRQDDGKRLLLRRKSLLLLLLQLTFAISGGGRTEHQDEELEGPFDRRAV